MSPKLATLFDSKTWGYKHGHYTGIPTLSAGKAIEILELVRRNGLKGLSKLNPSMTKEQAYQVLSSGLSEKQASAPISHLHAKNIVCEFGNDYLKIMGKAEGMNHDG